MISQKCPVCHSSRVRKGYRPTPFWSKLLFRYHLLCNNCNWEFIGFAVPGTVTAKSSKNSKQQKGTDEAAEQEIQPTKELRGNSEKSRVRKKIKIKV